MPAKKVRVTSQQEAIKAFLDAPDGTVAIVPTTAWADELGRRLLNSLKPASCILNSRIYTIKNFTANLSDRSRPMINHKIKRRLIQRLIKSAQTAYFRSPTGGVVKSIANAISSLKANNITPSELAYILKTRGGRKEADLLKIYQAYEDELSARGWQDEVPHSFGTPGTPMELLRNSYGTPMELLWNSYGTPFLIGFDSPSSIHRSIRENATYFEVQAKGESAPRVYSFNSPLQEARYIAAETTEMINAGVEPDKIGIHLKTGSHFAWEIYRCLDNAKAVPFRTATSQIISQIFNSELPKEANISEYIGITNDIIESKLSSSFEWNFPFIAARSLAYIASLQKSIRDIEFEYTTIYRDTPITREEFLAILHDEIDTEVPWPKDFPVKLVSFADAGLYKLTAGIIPQMNDGYMPTAAQQIRFFTEPDTLSAKPDTRIEEIFPSPDTVAKRELANFLSAHAGKTIITYPTHKATGEETAPSPFIMKYTASQPYLSPPLPTLRSVEGMGGDQGKNLAALPEFQCQMATHKFSASQFELYGSCPFAFFCRYILGIKPPEEKTPEVQPRDRGTLIHEILEEFFKANHKGFADMVRNKTESPDFTSLIALITDSVFAENPDIVSKYHPDMVYRLKRKTVVLVVSVLEKELETLRALSSPLIPTYFEKEFDDTIAGDVPVKGFIDRIDTNDMVASVTDYKTGKIGSVEKGIREGAEFQIPIYLEMAKRITGKEIIAGFLYSTKEQKRKAGIARKNYNKESLGLKSSMLVTDEEWDELNRIAMRNIREYAEKIRSGHFPPEPKDCAKYCDWKEVCRRSA